MIIVTGAAGFIGSNLLQGLNKLSYKNIVAVDDLTDGHKYVNLAQSEYADYMDYEDFMRDVKARAPWLDQVEVVFHQGACSATTQWDGRFMMKNNYEYSKELLHFSVEKKIPFIYASSAAVYGGDTHFDDNAISQLPLNVYGYSKWLFDQYVLRMLPKLSSQVVGLRYFNVYGPNEQHKGSMASVAFHLMNQLLEKGGMRLFEGSHGYADGEQLRDFVFVDDVVDVNCWFWQQTADSGVYNCGTGKARPFNAIANQLKKLHGSGEIQYIPFPGKLSVAYQAYTQANISKLLSVGYDKPFHTLEQGLESYYQWFMKKYSE